MTSTQALVDLVVENAQSRTFLTVLGFGTGNANDAMMEQISNQGNGVYAFVDSWREAKRQMVQQLAGNLLTVAKAVKIQVEFNPQQIQAYRLLGYENRIMAAEEFNAELLAVKLRYKQPEGDKSELLVFPLKNSEAKFNEAAREAGDPHREEAVHLMRGAAQLRRGR